MAYNFGMETFAERVARSKTRIVRQVFPHDANPIGTLYGGNALKWMDEIAFLTATRFSRCQVVTVSIHQVDFKVPIPEGAIIEMKGEVTRVGRTSATVRVQIFIEDFRSGNQRLAIEGHLVMVAVNEDKKPIPIMQDGQQD